MNTAPSAPFFALHGFAGTPETWLAFVPEAVAPLLTGHGKQPDFSSRSFEEEVARLAREARAVGTPLHLLGYSQGARLALGLLLEAPECFVDAVLVGVNPGLETDTAREERLAWEDGFIQLLHQHGLDAFVDAWENLPLFQSQKRLSEPMRERTRRARRSHTAEGLAHAFGVLGLGRMPSYWPRLAEIRVPVTLVVGELDTKFRALAERMCATMPQARLVSVPDVGHNPLVEAPDVVSELLLASS